MYLKIITIILLSVLYGLFEIIISKNQSHKAAVSKTGDKGSLWILIVSISVGYWLSFIFASTKIGRIYHWNILFIIGLLIAVIGLMIRITSILTLKKQFTYTVAQVDGHELIETGLYKSIRHPGYLGQMIIFSGIAVALSNWLSIILMIVSVFFGYFNRIKVEEKFMTEQLGEKYIAYQARTKKLIPAIY